MKSNIEGHLLLQLPALSEAYCGFVKEEKTASWPVHSICNRPYKFNTKNRALERKWR